MNWILTGVLCIVLIEFVVCIPFRDVILEIFMIAQKALHTLSSKVISDHWKEKVMLIYAGKLFVSTIKLAVFIVLIAIVAMMFIFVADFFGAQIGDFIVTWFGILYSIIIATIYLKMRKSFFV